jgi:HAMP domain-containing protein
MHRLCVVGVRVASSAAAVAGLVFIQFATLRSSYADNGLVVVAVDVTPTLMTAPVAPGVAQLPPTPIATPTLMGQPVPSVTSPSQQASDRIAAVSQQVADTANDASLPVETKVERINGLASQFNQLVAQWQQQLSQTSAAAGPLPPLANPQATPPVLVATPAPTVPTGLIPVQTVATPFPPPGASTADQLRAQIAAISQQMAQIAQDPSINGDLKTTQLAALGAQFNQLMTQLQQLGG